MSGRTSRSLVLLAASLSLAALACTMPTSPQPVGAEPMEPPLIYRVWWQQVEACAGRTSSFRAVSWYRVPHNSYFGFSYKGNSVMGLWTAQGNRIFLSEHVLDRGPVVRHEMLHAVLRTGEHPPEFFTERCRGWISDGSE